jgi:hypothetical protein
MLDGGGTPPDVQDDGRRRARVEVERWGALLKSGHALGLGVVVVQLALVLLELELLGLHR